jgi:hypothetical protein
MSAAPPGGAPRWMLDSEDRYRELYGVLTGQAGVPLAELGLAIEMPKKEVEPLTFGERSNPSGDRETERGFWAATSQASFRS